MPRVRRSFEETPHRRAFGQHVKALRAARGWTQETLAEHAAMDRSYLADVEAGGGNPTLDVIHKLATALGVPVADLFSTAPPSK